MTSEQIEAFLAQAGLDAGAVGGAERLLLPEPQVDEARTSRAGGVAFVPPSLLDVRSDALGAAGIMAGFDEDARTLVLSARQDLAFALAEPGALSTPGEAGGTRFHVATDRPSAFGLWTAAGPLAIGSIDARAIELRVVHAWPSPTGLNDSGVKIDSGVEAHPNDSGVEARPNDSGVEAHPNDSGVEPRPHDSGVKIDSGVETRPNDSGVDVHSGVVRPGSRWDETLAAGRIARSIEPGTSQAAAIAARRWTRGLTADQRTLIERFAIVQAQGIAERLERLQAHFGPADASLDLAWQAICWDRDDVEGIRVLLREAASGQTLAAVLRAADDIGRAVRFSWPSEVDVHDERLQRVSEADPGAWWGSTRRQVVWL